MIALCFQNILHIFRTRLVFLFLLFSAFLHFSGLKIIHKLTMTIEGVLQVIGPREGIFLSLYFQLFAGIFLAAVYGIWMIPYLHTGPRVALTFTLPVSKWKFPIAYALTFLGLILLEQVVMFGSFAAVFGTAALSTPGFPWAGLLSCIGLEILAFEVSMFAFALSSLIFGQVPTFFLGMMGFFTLQTVGSLLRIGFEKALESTGGVWATIAQIYRYLPPLGEIIFDLKLGFTKSFSDHSHFYLWGVWLLIFGVLFLAKLHFPAQSRSAEG